MTVTYVASQALVASTAAVYECDCGALEVDHEVGSPPPEGWVATQDGEHKCPHCSDDAAPASD